jgi:hypothetical protein
VARTNFTDSQRAEIFVLDRATCSYSGRNQWIADYGIDPSYAIDWADHLQPSSRGGPSTVENGAAASWLVNYLRGNSQQRLLLFHRGLPTADHAFHGGSIDQIVVANLVRFQRLHASDWFLNRAMWHIWIAMVLQYQRETGLKRARDYNYYAGAALKALNNWRRLAERDSITTLEKRRLVVREPAPDQLMLLQARETTSLSTITKLMKELYPIYKASANLIDALSQAEDLSQLDKVVAVAGSEKRVPKRIKVRVLKYADSLRRIAMSHV